MGGCIEGDCTNSFPNRCVTVRHSEHIASLPKMTIIERPQPFKIIKVTLDGEAYSSMHHLYVSSKGLTSNIEEVIRLSQYPAFLISLQDGKIETFYVHYSTIIKARFKTPLDSTSETTVTLDLTSPPTIGLSQLDKPALGPPATLVIVLYRDDREKFTRCLKARGLVRSLYSWCSFVCLHFFRAKS